MPGSTRSLSTHVIPLTMLLHAISRRRLTALLYVALLGAFLAMLRGQPLLQAGRGRSWPLIAALVTMAALSSRSVEQMLARFNLALDAGIAIATVALVTCGPWVALTVNLIPELIQLIRRPDRDRALGRLANVVSFCGYLVAGVWLLHRLPADGIWATPLSVIAVGTLMAAIGYLLARLLFATLSEGANPIRLLRQEFLPMLPAELAMLAVAAASTLLLPVIGVGALAPLATIVELPQLALTRLLRVRSVARLDVGAAAAVYRRALVDELGLPRSQRRMIERAVSIAGRRGAVGPDNARRFGRGTDEELRAVLSCALELEAITDRARTQPAYRAHPCVQVMLVAREWAGLTAQDTRALSHPEALAEITVRDIALDAPEAFAAACSLAQREAALTEDSTTVPRLHALPLPRVLRGDGFVTAVERLRA